MINMAYSHSQLQLYTKCSLRFRYKYIDKLDVVKDREESLALVLWKATHAALEQLYKLRRNYITPTREEIEDFFEQTRKEQLQEIYDKYKQQIFDDMDTETYFERWKAYIERYYANYFPFDQTITDSTEKTMWVEIKPWVKFQWIIDRLDIKWNEAYIVDYKTNKSLPTDEQDTIKDQLSIYWLAIQSDYWDKFDKIIWKVIYLHLQKEYTREITQEIIDSIRAKYTMIIDEIEHKRFAYQMWDQESFKPNPGRQCDDCPFHRLCPVYKHHYDNDDVIIWWDLETKTVKELIDEVYELWQQSKEIEQKKAMYLELLKEYAIWKWYTSRLRGHNAMLKIEKKKSFSITADIKDFIKDKLIELWLWNELSSQEIDKKKIETYLEQGWESASKLREVINPQEKVTIWRPKKISEKDNLEWDWVWA